MRSTVLMLIGELLFGLASGCGTAHLQPPNPPATAANILYDDDCDDDIDCAITQPILNHWIDQGYAKVWGEVSSAHTQLGAPTLKIFSNYYGHSSLFPIGALRPACESSESAAWNIALVNGFDHGDTCANYPSCATVLRNAVAKYVSSGGGEHGLNYVITGPMSCEEAFRNSQPDAISQLTGAQMEQLYIGEFIVVSGLAPNGGDYNCSTDLESCAAFFANVTEQNGYPPAYVVPVNTGAAGIVTQVPVKSLPSSNPTAVAFTSAGVTSRMDEDAMALEFAVYGQPGWIISSNSTTTVDTTTWLDSWNVGRPSGQYYLTVSADQGYFGVILSAPWLPKN